MTLFYRAPFCLLYIFILLSCCSGEAIKVSSSSLIIHEEPAVRDMELKPRQVRARPRVVRRNQLYYRPNLRKYPKGAVYTRYKLPPMYVTFRCPPRVGLLICRASCERRRRNVIGSCDNGYCTCLLLTPGFRGPGVFARRANCAVQAYKCHRFCQYQFGNSAYGSCRGNICRCFTNPSISLRNQSTACDQARRKIAYLEAHIRYILRKRRSEWTPSDIRLLQQVAKAPQVINRIAQKKQRSPTPSPKRPTPSPKWPTPSPKRPSSRKETPSSKRPSSRNDKKPPSSQGKGRQSQGRKRQDDDGEDDEQGDLQDLEAPQGQLPKPAGKAGQGQYPQVPAGRERLADGRDDPTNYPGSQYLDPEEDAQVEDTRYRQQHPQREKFENGYTQRPGHQEQGKLEGPRDPRDRQDQRDPRDPRDRDEEIQKLAEFEEEVDPAMMKQFEDVLQGIAPIRDQQSEVAAEREYDQYSQNPTYGNFLGHVDHQYRQREEPPPDRVSRNAAQADRLLI